VCCENLPDEIDPELVMAVGGIEEMMKSRNATAVNDIFKRLNLEQLMAEYV